MNYREEVWKDISGYEGLYQVSTFGRVRSMPNKTHHNVKILSPWKNHEGYFLVDLYKDGVVQHMRVNRLVLMTFLPTNETNVEISHLDENNQNNNLNNLIWTTHKDNCNMPLHKQRKKHEKSHCRVACAGIIYNSIYECATHFGIKYKTMWLWVRNKIQMPKEFADMGLKEVIE